MSQKVQDLFDDEEEFSELIDTARMNASNDWEETFVSDMRDKFDQFGKRMFISDSQLEHLERIAGDE